MRMLTNEELAAVAAGRSDFPIPPETPPPADKVTEDLGNLSGVLIGAAGSVKGGQPVTGVSALTAGLVSFAASDTGKYALTQNGINAINDIHYNQYSWEVLEDTARRLIEDVSNWFTNTFGSSYANTFSSSSWGTSSWYGGWTTWGYGTWGTSWYGWTTPESWS